VVDFARTANPLYRVWRLVLPDFRQATTATDAPIVSWLALVVALAVVGWRSVRRGPREGDGASLPSETGDYGRERTTR
jgi:hypothetical protein